MALQASGQIAMSDINLELGRLSNDQISLNDAEDGVYAVINTNSTNRPSSIDPAAMSEWYSYNHSAGSTFIATIYGRLQSNATSETGWYIEYRIDGGSWTTTSLLGTGLITCTPNRLIISSLTTGQTVQLRCTNNFNNDIYHNWAVGTTCPSATSTYGLTYYSFVVGTTNSNHACNVVVSSNQFSPV